MASRKRRAARQPGPALAASAPPPAYTPYRIDFPDGRSAVAVRAPLDGDVARIAAALQLTTSRPALFVSGGAGQMNMDDLERVRSLIEHGLAPFAEERGLAVVDGGTHAGVPWLLGDVRRTHGLTFPLIGVVPAGAIRDPVAGGEGPSLDSGHSHFVLVEADAFGQESEMIVRVTHHLAGEGRGKLLGLLINGGEITRQETYDRALSPHLDFRLLAFEGSGRFGDELARAARGEPPEDTRVQEILKRTEVHVVSADDRPEALYDELASYFA